MFKSLLRMNRQLLKQAEFPLMAAGIVIFMFIGQTVITGPITFRGSDNTPLWLGYFIKYLGFYLLIAFVVDKIIRLKYLFKNGGIKPTSEKGKIAR